MPAKKKVIEISPDMQAKPDPVVAALPPRKIVVSKPVSYPWDKEPLACLFSDFPPVLLDFARKNGVTPLKWRIQKGEYILFSDRLQKFHVPMD